MKENKIEDKASLLSALSQMSHVSGSTACDSADMASCGLFLWDVSPAVVTRFAHLEKYCYTMCGRGQDAQANAPANH